MTEPTDDQPERIVQKGPNTYQEFRDSLTDLHERETMDKLIFYINKARSVKGAITSQLASIDTMGAKTVTYMTDKRSPDLIKATYSAYRSAVEIAYGFLNELQQHNTALTMLANQVQIIHKPLTQNLADKIKSLPAVATEHGNYLEKIA